MEDNYSMDCWRDDFRMIQVHYIYCVFYFYYYYIVILLCAMQKTLVREDPLEKRLKESLRKTSYTENQ